MWGREQKETRRLGTWEPTSERQPWVVAGVRHAEGLGLDGGWGRVSLASQKLLVSSARCLPGLRLAPPSKVGSGSPGTICCWRREGRGSAGLGKWRARDGRPPPPLPYRRLKCDGGRETRKKTRCRTGFSFSFPLPLTVSDAGEGVRVIQEDSSLGFNHAWVRIGTGHRHTHTPQSHTRSLLGIRLPQVCEGRDSEGSDHLYSSRGLRGSKPEALSPETTHTHSAEAKPIYWLIGRRCWCGGVEEQGERLFSPYTRGGAPLPRLTEPAAVPN